VTDHQVARAENLIDLGRYAEAASLLRMQLTEDPNDVDLNGLYAQALVGLEDHPGALDAGNRVVALSPDDEWGHRICAIALRGIGNHAGAVTAAANAVRLGPLHAVTHKQYAVAALAIPHRRQEARAAAVRAVELAPTHADNHFVLGLVEETLMRVGPARECYQRTLQLDPTHSGAMNNLTNLGNRADLAGRARGYAAALHHDPTNKPAQSNIRALAGSLVRRFYWAALAALLVALAVAAADGSLYEPRFSWLRALVGVALLAGVASYTWNVARKVPLGVRAYARASLLRSPLLACTAALSLLMLLLAEAAAWLPFGPAMALGVLPMVGLLNVALVVGTVLARD
jgi:tetratricopeptide (TPR) repeat protein